MNEQKTIIVTGGSQGIGAGLVKALVARGDKVVATSRSVSRSAELPESDRLVRVDGDIGDPGTAARVVDAAVGRFGGVDGVVNNAGIFLTKPFTEYGVDDFQQLVNTNLGGFVHVTQRAVKQMLAQRRGGAVVSISTTLADHPIAGVTASVAMITKGGLEAVTRSLALEYARDGIRVNAVAPGIVDTPMHADNPKEFLRTLSPMGTISDVSDVVAAVLYLLDARHVTGEILHVDGGAHGGRW